ncbi:MAG TPA: electron transfer flavoprotein subunit alpha/FixB family protein [Spirochaetota bacterium]|mgnify:CR=1 FL=1|nr:electron transfer flavoprotein subunit alpha/FixB family protein [Spirochaetota bacterium]HPJ33365.1 electron transfer flavoprotein subunit alpha/FixB family protein [Spirochaetota bacterium]
MAGIYVYSDNVELSGELITLARTSGQEVCAVTMNDASAADMTAYGPDTVFVLKGQNSVEESYAAAIAKLLLDQKADVFMASATVRGRDIAAQVAARLGAGLISEAGDVSFQGEGTVQASRFMYGGLTEQVECGKGLTVITVAPGKYAAEKNDSVRSVVVSMTVDTDQRIKVTGSSQIVKEGADLSKAKRIVCVGMGFDKKDDLKIAEDLASALGAEVGCTRCIAEDREWMPAETYIGISGAVVKPDLYLALGVSGQIQHMFGVRDSKIVVGINNNEKATIFGAADYGIVGDLYEIAPLIAEAVKNS